MPVVGFHPLIFGFEVRRLNYWTKADSLTQFQEVVQVYILCMNHSKWAHGVHGIMAAMFTETRLNVNVF